MPWTPIGQALRATHNQSTETLGSPKVVKFSIYFSRGERLSNEEGIDSTKQPNKFRVTNYN